MRWLIRTGAFVRKELVDVARQPRLVFGLVLGPFLILALFGAGLTDSDPALRTVFVAPEDSVLAEQVQEFAAAQTERLAVEGVTSDEASALARLRLGEVEMVVVFPEDPAARVRSDEQAVILLYHDQIDPVEVRALALFARTAVHEINDLVLQDVIAESQQDASEVTARVADARGHASGLRESLAADDEQGAIIAAARLHRDVATLALTLGPALGVLDRVSAVEDPDDTSLRASLVAITAAADQLATDPTALSPEQAGALEEELAGLEEGLAEFTGVSPEVIVAPFVGDTVEAVEVGADLTDFYAPAVLIVLLQHMVLTLIGMSMIRERELGTVELFRVSPLSSLEVVVGKYLAYVVLSGVVAAALTGLLVAGLGVPLVGPWWGLALVVLVVVLASAGVGLLLALVADSDSQLVQFAMLVLLATIFFSGFLLSLERFLPWLRPVAYLLPATYGVELLRDVMLRGRVGQWGLFAGAGGLAAALFVACLVLLRRRVLRG